MLLSKLERNTGATGDQVSFLEQAHLQ